MNEISSLRQASWSWKHLFWLPLLGFILILTAFAFFNIDHGLQDWLYQLHTSSADRSFPFQNSVAYELWLHDRIKIASNSFLWVVLAAVLWPKKSLSWHDHRGPLLVALLAMIASASAMQSLKGVTGIYCPVQLKEFGGNIELHPRLLVGHLMLLNDGNGRCWPGGHSTTGFAWLAMFFALRQMGRNRAAFGMLIGALAYGHFLGLVQVIRGQHFLSHQFYTMAICWLISLGFFSIWQWSQNRKPLS